MEIAPFGSVKHVEAIGRVAGSMTVNEIKIDGETVTVCNVDQLLQLFRRSIATVASTQTTACHFAILYRLLKIMVTLN